MKTKMKWLLPAIATAALAACGGGSSDTVTETSSTNRLAELPVVKYATGCVPEQSVLLGMPSYSAGSSTITYWRTTDITVQGSLSEPTAVVSANVRKYSDSACTLQTQKLYAKGLATFSGDTKSLTVMTGATTKIGRKGQLKIADVSLGGVSLSASPSGAVVNFVVVDEGDKLYFGNGVRGADGYPSALASIAALKQP